MALTDQQNDFVQAVHGSRGSQILQALAGTGKTHTLLAACPEDSPTLALAFNKRIQTELDAKFPPCADCMTFNGLGHRTWIKHLGHKASVDTGKIYKICRGLAEEAGEERVWKNLSELMQLVNNARQSGMAHSKIQKSRPVAPLLNDSPEAWSMLCEDADLPDFLIELARRALLESQQAALKGEIDFQDQLSMPVIFRSPFPRGKYMNVMVDEAQDLGPLEHAMIELCLGKNSRLIAAGDHNQAIYGWRGAHADSMIRLQNKTSAQEWPLTRTFRCPKSVVAEAQRLVPEYEAMPENPEGTVSRWGKEWDQHSFTDLGNSVILCRNNKPLFRLAMRMLHDKIPCRMEGRDIGAGIKRIVKDITEDSTTRSPELLALVDRWEIERVERFNAKGDFAKVAKTRDQADSIRAIAEECQDSAEVTQTIDDLFGRKSTGITLSTIHKAKGLEWQNVYILDRHLIGSKVTADWAVQQERNLEYVAITRAMQSLTYLDSGE